MKDNVILVDADGVILNWEYAFTVWMKTHGFEEMVGAEFTYNIHERYNLSKNQTHKLIKIFNESAAIGFLPPLRDAMYYVKRLHEECGFVFHCITSLSEDQHAKQLREMNLQKLFGKTAFEEVICLATGADKDQALEPYRNTGCYWIEDKIKNAVLGAEMGLDALLMEHAYNLNFDHPGVRTVKNWKEIYNIVTAKF